MNQLGEGFSEDLESMEWAVQLGKGYGNTAMAMPFPSSISGSWLLSGYHADVIDKMWSRTIICLSVCLFNFHKTVLNQPHFLGFVITTS